MDEAAERGEAPLTGRVLPDHDYVLAAMCGAIAQKFRRPSLELWGFVLPKATAVLLELNPNLTKAVICTSTEMVTVVTRADGTPVEVDTEEGVPCVLLGPVAVGEGGVPDWGALARDYTPGFIPKTSQSNRHEVRRDFGALGDRNVHHRPLSLVAARQSHAGQGGVPAIGEGPPKPAAPFPIDR